MEEREQEQEVIKESKKLQAIVITVGCIIIGLICVFVLGAVSPMCLAVAIVGMLIWLLVLFIKLIYTFIKKSILKLKLPQNTTLHCWYNKLRYLARYTPDIIEFCKQNWFKIGVIILLLLILMRSFD